MLPEIFELQDWEAWRVPGADGKPSTLRITTDVVMPFEASTLLRITLEDEGFTLHAEDLNLQIVLTPRPGPEVALLFEQSLAYFLPVAFTEVDFPNNKQRTWLAAPARVQA